MAREEAPTVWSDDDRDDLIVIRQSLDTAPIRAAASRSHLRPILASAADTELDASSPATAADATDASAPHAAHATTPLMRIAWDRSLTLRQKLLRGAAISLLITLTLYLLIGGPAATGATLTHIGDAINARLHPPKPQPTLAERGYISIKSPPGAYNLPQISIAPAIGQGDSAWACWSSPFAQHTQPGAWSARAFYTQDGGAHWNPLALPQTVALGCSVLADGERADSALVMLTQGLAEDGACIAPSLYLTADTGASWTSVPWPRGPVGSACHYQAALQGDAIYLWANNPLIQGTNRDLPPTGRLIVSRDAGQTWAPADNGLDDIARLAIVGFRPGGHILASIANMRGSGSSSILMRSDDFGGSWSSLGALPGAFPQVFVSSDGSVTDHDGWGRLYVVARTVANGLPSVPPTKTLATAYIGEPWTSIPLPPLAPGADPSALSSQPLVIGVGPAATLEAERGIVEARDAQLSPSSHLWVWNPTQREWLLDPQAVPGNLELQGAAWRAGDQIVWMTTLQLGVPPVLHIYTRTYPADLLTHTRSGAALGS
jgi:hypothetical protein